MTLKNEVKNKVQAACCQLDISKNHYQKKMHFAVTELRSKLFKEKDAKDVNGEYTDDEQK